MPDPDLTPADDLIVKRRLSSWGHAFARVVETFPAPVEFMHAQLEGGAILTWDEGKVSFSRLGEDQKLTLEQINSEIEGAESDA